MPYFILELNIAPRSHQLLLIQTTVLPDRGIQEHNREIAAQEQEGQENKRESPPTIHPSILARLPFSSPFISCWHS